MTCSLINCPGPMEGSQDLPMVLVPRHQPAAELVAPHTQDTAPHGPHPPPTSAGPKVTGLPELAVPLLCRGLKTQDN